MERTNEFLSDNPPEDPKEEVAGLNEAIEATKRRIKDYQAKNWNASELETHLKSLDQRLGKAKEKAK